MCLNIGAPKSHHFPLGTNGKVVVLGVPILKCFRVLQMYKFICKIGFLFQNSFRAIDPSNKMDIGLYDLKVKRKSYTVFIQL